MGDPWYHDTKHVRFLLQLAVALLSVPLAIKVVLAKSGRMKFESFEAPGTDAPGWARAIDGPFRWGAENGFEFRGWVWTGPSWLFKAHIAHWRHPAAKAEMVQVFVKSRQVLEFCTVFEGGDELSTTTAHDAAVIPPPPGMYRQSFPRAGVDELWRRHTEGVKYLIANGCAPAADQSGTPIAERLMAQCRQQYAHVQTLRFYSLRYVWWMLTRPRRLRNLSVQDQHARGMIDVPAWTART